MIEVKVINGNIERAIAKFKKETAPVLRELRIRKGFESKAERRRRKQRESRRRIAKMKRKEAAFKKSKLTLYR